MSEPDITAYGGSWYAATMVEAPQRPPLALDLDVDVCVIGGGRGGGTPAGGEGRPAAAGRWRCWRPAVLPPAPRAAIPDSCCRGLAPTPTSSLPVSASSAPRI